MPNDIQYIVTCEHASHDIPAEFASEFESSQLQLNGHEGWDRGAFEVASELVLGLQGQLYYGQFSRLLVDLNRSLDHPRLFSKISELFPVSVKQKILSAYYLPYRKDIYENIMLQVEQGKKIKHFSIHSFTPQFGSEFRDYEVGLLFDPNRKWETQVARCVKKEWQHAQPHLRIEFNKPYLGTDDGFTTTLRSEFAESVYCGIEVELNQSWLDNPQYEHPPAHVFAV